MYICATSKIPKSPNLKQDLWAKINGSFWVDKVSQNPRQIVLYNIYDFLLNLYGNYVAVLHHFWDMASSLSKVTNFSYTTSTGSWFTSKLQSLSYHIVLVA